MAPYYSRSCTLFLLLLAQQKLRTLDAFVIPQSTKTSTNNANAFLRSRNNIINGNHFAPPSSPSSSSSSSLALNMNPMNLLSSSSQAISSTTVATPAPTIDTSSLTQYFLETLISYGVPAFFWIVIIGFAAKSIRGAQRAASGSSSNGPNGNLFGGRTNVVNELYNDLYGDGDGASSNKPFGMFGANKGKSIPKNLGIPKQQYLKITKLNDIYNSYDYTLTSATQSKALAAANYRSKAFNSALQKSFFESSAVELSNAQKVDLLLEEKEFLKRGTEILDSITEMQYVLTDLIIKDEMNAMDVQIGEVDVDVNVVDATIVEKSVNATATTNSTNANAGALKEEKTDKKKKSTSNKKEINKIVKEIEKENTELLRLEMEFIRAVVETMGPDRANAIRSALLGNIASGGSGVAGGLLKSLKDRPLSQVLETLGYSTTTTDGHRRRPNLFVTDFPGDVSASQVATLREEVTAILRASQPGDEVLLVLQTGGGTVTGYGLAAAQLQRFKKQGMKLTICVEQVAASGGYMMTCVADKVIASPFAVLGSIGVISDLPNFYGRLKKEGIEFQTVTAGKYKRTLTPTKKVTQEDIDKQKEDLEDILTLFKGFVKQNRPSLDIDLVATGETWFGEDALEKGLCDEIKTVDDVLVEYVDEGYNVYQVRYDPNDSPVSALENLLPVGRGANGGGMANVAGMGGYGAEMNQGGIVRSAVRWLVKSIVPTIKEELDRELRSVATESSTSQVQERYMFRDPSNSAKNIRMED